MGNRTDDARAARLLNSEVVEFGPTELGAGLNETFDLRGFSVLTAIWSTGSSCHSARISRAMSASATDHLSSSTGYDLMTPAGTTAAVTLSTAIDWPFAHLTATSSGSTGTLFIGLR